MERNCEGLEKRRMKTLDEVIKVYETGMFISDKSFDEALREFNSDALYYLKELRHILDNTVWVESTKEENGYWKLPMLPETGNDPLTWDELKRMRGKSVWLEYDWNNIHYKGWISLDHMEDIFIIDVKDEWALSEVNMDKWKAYRKERK